MCFDADSHPPISAIAGAAVDGRPLELTAADGNRFAAFGADAPEPTGAGIVVLPDVRGLVTYYEELALRFAESGVDAIAIDYYGRTAGASRRDAEFEFESHTERTTWAGLRADVTAAAEELRSSRGITSLFSVGFSIGGRLSFLLASVPGLGMSGVIGFYGRLTGPTHNDMPAPLHEVERFEAAVLGLFGGADPKTPGEDVQRFEAALAGAGVEHRIVSYPGAPHSFFDRKEAEYASASANAWSEVGTFIDAHRTASEGSSLAERE